MYFKWILVVCALILSSKAQNNETHRTFPDGFLFGCATASYQVEGGWNSADKGENIWDYLTHNTDLVDDLSTGDIACDSYNNYARDVEMLKEMGVNFYRFSLSWSRILPTGFDDHISADGIDYYNRLINLLIANGITPVVTLYHWDLPQPLQLLGGWPNGLIEKYFTDYARVAFEAFGDRVSDWLTFNEPVEVCRAGYGNNAKAPALNFRGIAEYLCAHTLIKSHASVYHLYNDVYKPTQNGRVGMTLSSLWTEPDSDSPGDIEAAERTIQFQTGWFANPIFSADGDYPAVMKERIALRSREQGYSSSRLPVFTAEEVAYIKGTYDFFGVNHYSSSVARVANASDYFDGQSWWDDLGVVEYQRADWLGGASAWLKVVPWGFTKLLLWITERYNSPEIIIFENGFSDRGGLNDTDRINYYHLYLNAMLDAIEEGATVSGFTAWSLMDNFEWLRGYTERFGLYEVDYDSPNRTRTAKASSRFYSDIISTRTISRVTTNLKN